MEVVVKVEEVAVRVNTPVQGRDRSVFVALSQVIAMFMFDSDSERTIGLSRDDRRHTQVYHKRHGSAAHGRACPGFSGQG